MRSVVLSAGISLDGYIAHPNGDVDLLFMPKDYSMAPFFATLDTAVLGRETLEAGLRMGGGELAREFLIADLVDEIDLGVVPMLLGEGIPLFLGGFPQREFGLVENKTYGKGLIGLKYQRNR